MVLAPAEIDPESTVPALTALSFNTTWKLVRVFVSDITPVPNGNLSSAAPVATLKVPSVAIVTSNSFKKGHGLRLGRR